MLVSMEEPFFFTADMWALALGGTLSSYAWICMILHFLQTRNPPILPSLHGKARSSSPLIDGKYAAFNDNVESLRGFGKANKETLGDLLFQFFRRYAHDIDYEKYVISVREGRLISKEAKKWHLMQNNRLCVEEPFNTERNLGNTADDISFRGIHLEMRRAFDLVADAKLSQCIESYNFPATEEKVWERPTPKPPPVLTRSRSQSQSSRGKGGYGNRGGRHNTGGPSKSRRASSAAATNKYPLPPNGVPVFDRPMLTQGEAIQAQFEQLKLHRQLFDEMQTLQRQEYELRLKHAQNQLQAEFEIQSSAQGPPSAPQIAREPRRHPLTPQVPMSAPMRSNQQFPTYMCPQVPGTPPQNVHTQPSSPSLRTVQPDLRRSIHRSSATDGSSSGRSHSQPARGVPPNPAIQSLPPLPPNSQQMLHFQNLRQYQMQQEHLHNPLLESQSGYRIAEAPEHTGSRRSSLQRPFEEAIPKEYAGYWINDSPPSHPSRDDYRMPRVPQLHDLYPRVRGVPPPLSRLHGESRSPSPSPALPLRDRSFSLQSAPNGPLTRQRFERVPGTAPTTRTSGPLIVNGTDALLMPEVPPMLESSSRTTTVSEATSGSDENTYQTPITGEVETCYSGPFEESFAYDQAQHLYHSHQMADRLRHAQNGTRVYMEPSARRLSNQPSEAMIQDLGLKPIERRPMNGRGLNIQFGELDYSRLTPKIETRAAPEASKKPEEVLANVEKPAPATDGQPYKGQGTAPLLSPVREARTPSPAGRRMDDAADLAKVSSIKRASGKMDLTIPSWAELVRAKHAKERSLTSATDERMNGHSTPKANGVSPMTAVPIHSARQNLQPHNTPISGPLKSTSSQALPNGWQQQPSRKHKKNKSRTESGQHGEPFPSLETERKGG